LHGQNISVLTIKISPMVVVEQQSWSYGSKLSLCYAIGPFSVNCILLAY